MTKGRLITIGGILAALIAVGCGGASGDKAADDQGAAAPAGGAATGAKAPAAKAALTAADIDLPIKITSKKCFGSAGCNVEFLVDPAVDKSKLQDDKTYLITYEVSGVEDGPQINTFTLNGDGSYASYEVSGYASTASKSAKLKTKITEVEVQ